MNLPVQRPLWLWLLFSVFLHAAVVTAPGWSLPEMDDRLEPARLDTRLVPVVAKAAQAQSQTTPPRPKPARPEPAIPEAAPQPEKLPQSQPAPPPPVAAPDPSPEPPAAVPPASTFADVWPRAGRLVFKIVRGDGFHAGQAEHRWQHDGERYQLRAVTETVGLAALFHSAQVVQESQGLMMPYGLQPLEFRVIRNGKLREAARIDPAQRTVFLGHGQHVAIAGPVQDVLTLFYQHGAMADDAAAYSVTIATGRRVGEYHVSVDGREKLETPWGERDVRHLRMYSNSKEDSSEIWLDEITRLPFKIRYKDGKGDIFDQIIETGEVGKTE